MWWYGGDEFGGAVTIKNCRVVGPGSAVENWYFADLGTSSSAPNKKFTNVVVEDNYFEASSAFTVRGMAANANDSVIIRNNDVKMVNQSDLMWDVFEINNTDSVVCTGNTVTNLTRPAGSEISMLQSWSRAGPWNITFKDNSISGGTYVVKYATSATFYEATGTLAQGTGTISDTTYSVARTYDAVAPKWQDGVRSPENSGQAQLVGSFVGMSEAPHT
jgi:hypothetical protein